MSKLFIVSSKIYIVTLHIWYFIDLIVCQGAASQYAI